MKKAPANSIVIDTKEKLEAIHNLMHLLEKFKYSTKSSMCMMRDKAACQEIVEEIRKNLETVLL